MPLTSSTVAAIDRRTKVDPDFAAAVDAELQTMRIEQELVAVRAASRLLNVSSPRNSAVRQPVIAKLEAGETRDVGLQTVARADKTKKRVRKNTSKPTH